MKAANRIKKLILMMAVFTLVILAGNNKVKAEAGEYFKSDTISLNPNKEYKIDCSHEDAPVTGYKLYSSDRSVACISKLGRIMTFKEGTCILTAVGSDGTEEQCVLTVKAESLKGVQIALTFDDGPGGYSKELLDFLASRGVHVTYFLIGNQVSSYASIVKRMVEDGHEVGNHTFTHPSLNKQSLEKIREELDKCSEAIYEASGSYPTVMRPPYGATNDTVLAEAGMPVILWNIDTLDWKYRDADYVYDQIVSGARDGNIILVHEIHKTTIEGAKRAIDTLLEQGVEFLTVSELLTRNGETTVAGKKYFNN